MGRKSSLTSEEKLMSGLIRMYHCLVAKSVQNTLRSVCGVCHFLKNECNYGNNMEERITTCEIAVANLKNVLHYLHFYVSNF